MDHLSPAGRSKNMSSIRSKNTKPELKLRAALRESGAFGYRLNRRGIFGCPDISFSRWKVAVFVDGVFWHGHPNHIRENASSYWKKKIKKNQDRDKQVTAELTKQGWSVLRLWDEEINSDIDIACGRVLSELRRRGWLDGEVER